MKKVLTIYYEHEKVKLDTVALRTKHNSTRFKAICKGCKHKKLHI